MQTLKKELKLCMKFRFDTEFSGRLLPERCQSHLKNEAAENTQPKKGFLEMNNIYRNSLAFAASISLLLALSACSPDSVPDNSGSSVAEDSQNGAQDSGSTTAAFDIPNYPDGYPTDQDIIDAYKTAADVVGWFSIISTPPLDTDKTVDVDGLAYCKVKSEQVTSTDTLRKYLETIFDYDMADLLMDINDENQRFIERDDGLYCTSFAFLPTGYSDEENYAVTKVSDDEYKLAVSYQVLNDDGSVKADRIQNCTFKKIEGRWVFYNFILYRQ